jgi:hypothetical protein
MTRCLAFVSAFFLSIGVLTQPALAEKRVALVIGNDRYDGLPALQKAVNDARAVAERFQRLGYEVIRVENAPRRAMNEKISELTAKLGRGDTAAFFFAGHGVEIKGVNYLLPTDTPQAREGQEDLIASEAITANSIIDRLQERGARATLLILDACRDNPFKTANSRGVGGSRGLGRIDTQEGVFVLYSAGIGQAALDRLNDKDADPNSVFTRTLIRLMEKPGLSVQELAKTTQSEVRKLAATVSHFQMPAYYDQIDGIITLAGAAAAKAVAPGPESGRPFAAAIVVKHSNKCVEVGQTNLNRGAAAVQQDCSGKDNQKWEFTPTGDGYYVIKARHSGKCLDVVYAGVQWGIFLWQWDCVNVDNQKFKLTPDGAGFYNIRPKHSGLCLDILNGFQENMAVLLQWSCHAGDNQRFRLAIE